MWNSQNPLNLLLSMPTQLTKENLQNLQEVIDVDKILNSQTLHHDLCGEYAPFCEFCDKSIKYPCAHAYVKFKQADGLDVEIPETVIQELQVQPEKTEEKPKNYIRIAVAKKVR